MNCSSAKNNLTQSFVSRPGFISRVEPHQKTLENGFHSLPSARRDSVENKPASLFVSLSKALIGMPPFSCDRQVVRLSSLLIVEAKSDERHTNREQTHTNERINTILQSSRLHLFKIASLN